MCSYGEGKKQYPTMGLTQVHFVCKSMNLMQMCNETEHDKDLLLLCEQFTLKRCRSLDCPGAIRLIYRDIW
jgi:hypothetical protein